jgi:hypothetical protein
MAGCPCCDSSGFCSHTVVLSGGCNRITVIYSKWGSAFTQAVWELLYNNDCSINSCTAVSMPNRGNYIWPNTSAEQVIDNVGDSLAFVMSVLGQNVTFANVTA